MNMPSAAWAIVVAMFQQKRMDYPATEDGARAWTRATCEQLRFSFPDGWWCTKSAGAGRPQSKDVVARLWGGKLEGWGVLTAAGAQGPRQLTDPPEYYDLTGQLRIEVSPVNHLATVEPTPEPAPEPDAPNPDDPAALVAALERIYSGLQNIAAGLDTLTDEIAAARRDVVRVHIG